MERLVITLDQLVIHMVWHNVQLEQLKDLENRKCRAQTDNRN